MTYSREHNLGKPRTVSTVEVNNLSEVVAALVEATNQIKITVEELKKITFGTGLLADVDLNEEIQ